MKLLNILTLFLLSCPINGFMSSTISPTTATTTSNLHANVNAQSADDAAVKVVDRVLSDMHNSGYPFRIVVIGSGAILETTSVLGPTMKSSTSPKTGDRLVTLASEDQSFEFHVKVDQVHKVIFAESVRPLEGGDEKVLRICRFMNSEGGSICSLILNESGEDAIQWFDGMKTNYAEQ